MIQQQDPHGYFWLLAFIAAVFCGAALGGAIGSFLVTILKGQI